VIECTGATVSLGGRRVLDDVSIKVARGEWVTIVGPNGAGKSTLLRFLAGVVEGTGTVLLDAQAARDLSRRRRARLVALVPQLPIVPDGARVADYVLLGRTPYISALGVEGADDVAAARDALARLDLIEFAERQVSSLSGGERQRVLIARAIAQGSPIVLFDEPTTSLDVGHQQQVLELIDRLRRDHGLSVVSTMHDLTLAGQYSDRLVLLHRGRVVTEGAACDVLTEENLAQFYDARVRVVVEDGRPVVLPLREAERT
jgi:iron complex transport system ATP-binding protein